MNNVYCFVPFIIRSDGCVLFKKNTKDGKLSFPKFKLKDEIHTDEEANIKFNKLNRLLELIGARLSNKPYVLTIAAKGLANNVKEMQQIFILFADKIGVDNKTLMLDYVWMEIKKCLNNKQIGSSESFFIETYLNNKIVKFDLRNP